MVLERPWLLRGSIALAPVAVGSVSRSRDTFELAVAVGV
jgi:hypothetical protein